MLVTPALLASVLTLETMNADWIAPAEPSHPPRLRRVISLPEVPSSAKIRVVGLGHHELRCNGKVVGDSVINQAWSQYDATIYWQEFELAPYLVKGENVLGVTLGDSFWRVGPVNDAGRFSKTDAEPNFSNGHPYLLWIDGAATVGDRSVPIVTDSGWMAGPSPVTFSHLYAGEDFDARLDLPGWDTQSFTPDARWTPAVKVEPPAGRLRPLPCPPIRTFEVFAPTEIKPVGESTFTYVFPQNASSLLKFTVRGEAGARIRFRPCEYMQPDGRVKFTYTWGTGKDIWHDYTLRGGEPESHRILFCYLGAQYVQVDGAVPEGIANPNHLPVISSMQLVHTRLDCPQVGGFTCDSPVQSGAERLIDWSIRSNMSYVPTDCPHREKNGWLEQDWHMARAVSYRYDIHQWFTKVCRDMHDAQSVGGDDDGFVPTNAPWYLVGRPRHDMFNDAPEWGVSMVLVPWHLYEWYGDAAPLREHFDAMARFVDFLTRQAKDGAIGSHLGDWYDYGHGKGDGPSQWTPDEVSATAIWALGAKTVADAAAVLGKSEEHARYLALFERIRSDFQRRFYDPATHTVLNRGSCQAANATALCVGLIPDEDRAAAAKAIVSDLERRGHQQTAGEVLHVFFMRALAEYAGSEGRDALHATYAREGAGSYAHMVSSGLTTLPESWDARPGTGNSMNHMMFGHLMEWHHAYVAGIRQAPGSVGWKRAIFAPQPPPAGSEAAKAMRRAEVNFRSPSGEIKASWVTEQGEWTMRCTLPPGISGEARLPDGTSRVMEAGENVYRCRAR